MRRTIFFILLLIAFLVGCNTATPTPTPSPIPTDPPTATLPPTETPAPTDTPTPTLTPTETSTPTITPSPTPSPTPKGYYQNDGAAFSVTVPFGWTVTQEDNQGAIFQNEQEFISLYLFSDVTPEEITPEEYAQQVIRDSWGNDYEILNQDEVTLANGQTTAHLVVSVASDNDLTLTVHILTPRSEGRQYYVFLLGPSVTVDPKASQFNTVFSSINLLSGQIYGLNRNEALVILGYEPDPEDIDPARTLSGAYGYGGVLFSGLVRLSQDMQIIPDLAESWTISPDGTTYTFTLRENAKFADGKPITAEDVKYSWERAADPETKSSTVETYMGDILGLKEKMSGDAEEISGVKVLDARTLEVTLDGPKPYFLAKLSYPSSFIIDQTDVIADAEKWMFNPNASGPYRVQEIREKDAIILVRNDMYYAPAKTPYLIYLLYRSGTDVSYYQAGEIDIAYIGTADAQAIQDDPSNPLNDELHVSTTMCMSYVQLNNTLPPFDDPKVREAFTLAVDKARMNELFGENHAFIANAVLPPAMPGFNLALTPQPYDPDAARAALNASTYAGNLPTITLLDPGYGDSEDPFNTALIDMWKETLGVDIVVEYVDPRDPSTSLRAAQGHLTSSGWCADYPDPENFLDVLFHPDSSFNYMHYDNPAVTALLEQARTELDPAQRISLYQQAEIILLQDFGVIPIFYSTSYTLVKPYLQGWVDSAMRVQSYHLLSVER